MQYVPVPWPLLGVSRRMPGSASPPLTCPDARNVRARAASSKALGGGRRPGMTRAIPSAIGGTPRITCLRAYGRIPNTTAPDTSGVLVPQIDNASEWALASGAADLNNVTTGTTFPYGGAWVAFRKKSDAEWVRGEKGTLPFVTVFRRISSSANVPGLFDFWTRATTTYGDQGEYALAINYATDNNVLVRMVAHTAVSAEHDDLQCNNLGPFVRASNDLKQKICAYLEWTGEPNVVRLVIDKLDNTTVTRLATGREFRLRGKSTTIAVRDSVNIIGGLFIRLRATALKLTATVEWAASGVGADVNDTLEIDNTDWATNTRAGVILRKPGTKDKARSVLAIEYNRREPYDFPLAADGDVKPARYEYTSATEADYVPAGWTATLSTIIHAGAFAPSTTTSGTYASGSIPGTVVRPVAEIIEGTALRSVHASPMVTNAAPTGSDVWAIDLAYRDSNNASTDNDTLCPCFNVTANFKYFLRVELDRSYNTLNKTIGQSEYRRIIVKAFYDPGTTGRASTTLYSAYNLDVTSDDPGGTDAAVIFSTSGYVRWALTGGNVLQCFVNGMLVWSASLGVIPASVNGTQVGVDCTGVDAANADIVETKGVGWQVRNIGPVAFTPVTQGVDVIASSSGLVSVGDLGAGTWTSATGGGPSGTLPEMAFLLNKAYLVDGLASYEIDIPGRKVANWPSVSGTALDKCSLSAAFLGRVFIAGQSQSNPSAWFCSATLAPRDFDFGSPITATKAYAGTDPSVGQPGDDIVAMIPSWDDVLFFACRGSWWALMGDPGRGGRCQVFNQGVGILAQRAWTFDNLGNLYFLSASGLCRISRKTLAITQLSAGDLPDLLESIDTSATLVQLAFEPTTKTVHIFLTPTDGTTVGTHVVYDPTVEGKSNGGGFWIDSYPLSLQPWAVSQALGRGDVERRLLMGGGAGVVTRFADAATGDDGTAIDAWIKMDPIEIGGGGAESTAMELQGTLDAGSGPVNWYWHTANSATEVEAATVGVGSAHSGSWTTGGRQQPAGLRSMGGAHMLALRQNALGTGFAVDRILAGFRPEARVRTGV